jgi:hypothetical protein
MAGHFSKLQLIYKNYVSQEQTTCHRVGFSKFSNTSLINHPQNTSKTLDPKKQIQKPINGHRGRPLVMVVDAKRDPYLPGNKIMNHIG